MVVSAVPDVSAVPIVSAVPDVSAVPVSAVPAMVGVDDVFEPVVPVVVPGVVSGAATGGRPVRSAEPIRPCPLGVVLLPWGQALVVDGDAARTSPADVLVRREEWEATLPAEVGGARVELVSLSTPLSGVVLRWLDGARETSGSCTFERERLRTCRLFGADALVVDLRLDEASDVAGVATATATRGELSAPVGFRRR